jgi:hypothetical protein
MRKVLYGVSGAALFAVAGASNAASYAGLTVDLAGIDAAAVAIATAMMGVLAVFWGVKKIMGLVG